MTPARLRAALARVDADLVAARLRLSRLERDAGCCGPEHETELAAKMANVEAQIAELEAEREELTGASAESPSPVAVPVNAPANDTTAVPAGEDDWLTTKEAAAILRVTVKGLERMRADGRGPAHTRIGRSVRYRRGDLRRAK
jgi:excisionase family DNA binding protein